MTTLDRQQPNDVRERFGMRRDRCLIDACAMVVLTAVVLSLQVASGAYESEFGGHPDEAAHYCSGLMMRDYLTRGLGTSPMSFAEEFYVHYPKIAIGHWPPLFYLIQAGWTLVFGETVCAIMALLALITTALGGTLYLMIRREFGPILGLFCSCLLVMQPAVQVTTSAVLSDSLLALLLLWSIWSYAKYLGDPSLRNAIIFGFLASLALYTKPAAMVLALVPGLAILISGKWTLLRRFSFWLPPIIVAVVCAPWYVSTLAMARMGTSSNSLTLGDFAVRLARTVNSTVEPLGWLIALSAVGGAFFVFRRSRTSSHVHVAMGTLFLGDALFLALMPVGLSGRYLIPLMPPLLYFAAAGIYGISKVAGERRAVHFTVQTALAVLLVSAFFANRFEIPPKRFSGFARLLAELESKLAPQQRLYLVIADDIGEGMFVSEVAKGDQRPDRIVLRGSKMLAHSDWNGTNYESLFQDVGGLRRFLESVAVNVIVLDQSSEDTDELPHVTLLKKMLDSDKGHWDRVGILPVRRNDRRYEQAILVYRRVNGIPMKNVSIRIDMRDGLGKCLNLRVKGIDRTTN